MMSVAQLMALILLVAGCAGFTWRFVVASREVARSLAGEFGDQVLSPPATPSWVLGRDGGFIEKHLGIQGADDLVALFDQYRP